MCHLVCMFCGRSVMLPLPHSFWLSVCGLSAITTNNNSCRFKLHSPRLPCLLLLLPIATASTTFLDRLPLNANHATPPNTRLPILLLALCQRWHTQMSGMFAFGIARTLTSAGENNQLQLQLNETTTTTVLARRLLVWLPAPWGVRGGGVFC